MIKGSDFSSSLWFLVLQWAYALWQAVRNTRGFNLIFYTLQWLGSQCLTTQENRNKTVVWVNKEHHGDLFGADWQSFRTLVLYKNIEDMNMEFLEFKDYWYQVKYRGKHYWVHQNIFFELYMYKLRNCVFVKDLYYLDVKYAVAQKISEEEAMLLMFNKDMHLFPVKTKHVIYGQEINIEYNSKLSGFLSTIPLIMQARGLNGMSAWALLILLLIDLFRTPMYRLYDMCFFHLVKFFKLRVFMQTTWLYTFFGLFSDRWRYSDFTKGYAYLTHEGQEIEVTTYVSSFAKDDCTLSTLRQYEAKSPDMQHFCIRDRVITSGGFNYDEYSAIFKVKKGMFVT